jgi:serine/threonine protein kinase
MASPAYAGRQDVYEKLAQVGEGTYGRVYKARCRTTGALVALKRIRLENEKEGVRRSADLRHLIDFLSFAVSNYSHA